MDSNLLILRFRDPTDDVKTIAAHEEIISNCGAVWWGWWKAQKETLTDEELNILNNYSKDYVMLIDRSLNMLYKATVKKISTNAPNIAELNQTPAYYRDKAPEISTWFLLSSIEKEPIYSREYDDTFAERGNPTYIFQKETSNGKIQKISNIITRNILEHENALVLSDLHFGENYNFCFDNQRNNIGQNKTSLSDGIISDLRTLGLESKISLIIITGDFTTKGDWTTQNRNNIINELHLLCNRLNISRENIVAVPGNHDMVRFDPTKKETIKEQAVANQIDQGYETGFRLFVSDLNGRDWRDSLTFNIHYKFKSTNTNLDLTVLNSCRIVATEWSEYGYVGQEGIDIIKSLPEDIEPETYRVIALHHHLLPVNDIDFLNPKGVSLTLDSLNIIKNALSRNVTLALHGHQHTFNMAKYTFYERNTPQSSPPTLEKSLTVLANGSTGVDASRRTDSERNMYTLLRFEKEGVKALVRELMHSGHQGITIMDKTIS